MRKYPCSFMFQQITCIPQVVTITNLLHPPDDPIFPIRLVIPSPTRITHHQDNLFHRITQSPNRPHIDNPISTSPSESSKITTPKCMCAVSTSQYRFQFTVSIPTGCPHITSGYPISENTHTKNINFD